jgi:hypothetical protein
MRLTLGFLLVLLAPLLEFFVWVGAGGIYKLSDLLGALAISAGVPLFVGLALIMSRPSEYGSGPRLAAAILLIAFVAPVGQSLAAKGNYSHRDEIITEIATAALPAVVGLAILVGVWTARRREMSERKLPAGTTNDEESPKRHVPPSAT